MFDNIGSKIKSFVTINAYVGIGIFVLLGLLLMADNFLIGLLTAAIGSSFCWISSFVMYGLGQLIENSYEMVRLLKGSNTQTPSKSTKFTPVYKPATSSNQQASATPVQRNKNVPIAVTKTPSGKIICPTCSLEQWGGAFECSGCGQVFMNGQKVPYWCGKCGKAGPFAGDVCPDCGSSFLLNNI